MPLVLAALAAADAPAAERPFYSTVRSLPAPVRADLTGRFWRPGCPVQLSDLRLLTVAHWGFDGKVQTGQLVVARQYANALRGVFRRLYDLRFAIRHMRLADMYGAKGARPPDGDVSGSFECRQSVPSPCVGGSASGRWSNHAYGLAIDLNPRENPYVGCGRTRDRASARTPTVPAAQGDGDACRRSGVPLDRLGLGRRLDGPDQGLHALLRERPLGS